MTAIVSFDREAIRSLSPEGQREVVGQFIEQGRNMLAQAIEASDLYGIRDAKGAASTINEMTRQLGLSKEARVDAEELVRRGEYELGKAIRAGQADESVLSGDDIARRNGYLAAVSRGEREPMGITHPLSRPTVTDIEPEFYSNRAKGQSMADLVDGVSDDEFEQALTEAKSEGNVSRANVARKIKQQKSPQTRDQRAEKVADLAEQGYSSHQIAKKLGLHRGTVVDIARDYDITLHADKVTGGTHHIDSARVVRETVSTLEGLLITLPMVDMDSLDPREANEWTASLDQSIRALNRFNKKIKETVR